MAMNNSLAEVHPELITEWSEKNLPLTPDDITFGSHTMQRFITDERTGIRYELIGDYYYPCLTVEESPPLSKYGWLRQRYLREHKRVLYFNLLTSGKLYEHLAEIDTSARDMAEYLIKEMAKKQGVTEELKAADMMRWIGLMNNIRACADEIVLNDIVYS